MPLVAKSEAVLMHLLVLGAFCREIRDALYASEDLVLMHLLVLGAFCPPPCLWERRRCATSRGWSATGSPSTPRDRPALLLFNHLSAS